MKRFLRDSNRWIVLCLLWICSILFLTGCGRKSKEQIISKVDTAMGTIIQQTIYLNLTDSEEENKTAEDIIQLVERLEKQELSWRLDTSMVYQINQNAGAEEGTGLLEPLALELEQVLQISEESKGALDVTIGDVVRLWDIDAYCAGEKQDFQLPASDEIQKALEGTGYEKISIKDQKIFLPEGIHLDLGAVGKGLACERIKAYLEEQDSVKGAVISVGGSILTFGEKPDGTAWKVGIVNPHDTGNDIGYLTLNGQWCVSTSGDYERYVEVDGKRYHHIIDPATGYPADSKVSSVTILGKDGLITDALSTACFVLGVEDGLKLAQRFGVEALFIDQDGKQVLTEGMNHYFGI